MPGFPGATYSAPAAGTPIYRYSNAYKSGTPWNTLSSVGKSKTEDLDSLPYTIQSSNTAIATTPTTDTAQKSYAGIGTDKAVSVKLNNYGEAIIYRDISNNTIRIKSATSNSDMANSLLSSMGISNILNAAETEEINLVRARVDGNADLEKSTEEIIGQTIAYGNKYNWIRVKDNFIKVGLDSDGVYFIINKWRDIIGEAKTLTKPNYITEINAQEKILRYDSSVADDSVDDCQIVYAENGNNTYSLHYEIKYSNGAEYLVDCVDGGVTQTFYGK